MVIKVYSKHIENAGGSSDGAAFNEVIQVSKGSHNEAQEKWILGKIWAKMAPSTKKGLNRKG